MSTLATVLWVLFARSLTTTGYSGRRFDDIKGIFPVFGIDDIIFLLKYHAQKLAVYKFVVNNENGPFQLVYSLFYIL